MSDGYGDGILARLDKYCIVCYTCQGLHKHT